MPEALLAVGALTANVPAAADASAALGALTDAAAAVAAALRHTCTAVDAAYVAADPLVSGTALALAASFVCWFLSVTTGNYSWTDRFWSITPPLYALHFAFFHTTVAVISGQQTLGATLRALLAGGADRVVLPSARLLLMALLPALWGARLTFNFARKGGYRLDFEDYRWAIVRTWFPPVVYQIFNVVFIALYQNLLIFAIILPAYVALRADARAPALTALDGIAVAAFAALLAVETVADNQQWAFQTRKYELIRQSAPLQGDYARGFLTAGLFRYSRHPVRRGAREALNAAHAVDGAARVRRARAPLGRGARGQNFFAEMGMWWAYYLFSVAASGVWLNWTVAGTALLTLLFQGSTTMTEVITARKYPAYTEYQRTTSRLLPWFPGTPAAGAAAAPATVKPAEKPAASPPTSPAVVAARSPAAPPSSARSPRTRAQRSRRTQHD